MAKEEDGVCIRVSKEIHRYLIDRGRKNESFDQILRRLLGLGHISAIEGGKEE